MTVRCGTKMSRSWCYGEEFDFNARNFATSQSVFHTLVDTHARAQEHN